jgi:hypothetical protein
VGSARPLFLRIPTQHNSRYKNDIIATPQFNSWGAKVTVGKEVAGFDEPTFNAVFDRLQASGMKAGMFVFDQKWLGKYGELDPSPERFSHFDQCFSRVRSAGYRLGFA